MNLCTAIVAAGLHLGSIHAPAYNYNNLNPGAYVRCDTGLQVGAYYNSERRMTAYGAYLRDVPVAGPVGVWGSAGIATGYQQAPVVPMLMVGVKAGPVRVGYIPRLGKLNDTNLIHFAVEARF